MKNLIKFLLLSVSLSIISCNDDDNQNPNILPEATQTGANTGGALIDGKVWVAKKEKPDLLPGGNNTKYTYNGENYIMEIYLNGKEKEDRINITISDINEITTKTYSLISSNYINGSKIYDNQFVNKIGSLTISKFDKKNKIVSGTFSFEAGNINGDGSKVIVTEGRFDKEFF